MRRELQNPKLNTASRKEVCSLSADFEKRRIVQFFHKQRACHVAKFQSEEKNGIQIRESFQFHHVKKQVGESQRVFHHLLWESGHCVSTKTWIPSSLFWTSLDLKNIWTPLAIFLSPCCVYKNYRVYSQKHPVEVILLLSKSLLSNYYFRAETWNVERIA